MSLFLSPATGKFTIVNDDALSAAGNYGVDRGKKFRSEMGALLKFQVNKEILKNVTAQTKLDLFSNYFHNPQNIDVDWSVLINMKVNEYLSANLVSHAVAQSHSMTYFFTQDFALCFYNLGRCL